jgi:hypothetical protein
MLSLERSRGPWRLVVSILAFATVLLTGVPAWAAPTAASSRITATTRSLVQVTRSPAITAVTASYGQPASTRNVLAGGRAAALSGEVSDYGLKSTRSAPLCT